ncbi:MAG TPA: cupin domain-containing protein [Sedimentisphaerales bacterium]|nr:cupin domain-containing protein [Sedimentisphaerales bacterium]
MAKYIIVQLDEIEPVDCPCGQSRRAFLDAENSPATLHIVDITQDARLHYHKKLTEIYIVLEGNGYMELDDQRVPIKPMTAILIKPGCRHRAVGRIKTIVFAIPAFDPQDEWFDQ